MQYVKKPIWVDPKVHKELRKKLKKEKKSLSAFFREKAAEEVSKQK